MNTFTGARISSRSDELLLDLEVLEICGSPAVFVCRDDALQVCLRETRRVVEFLERCAVVRGRSLLANGHETGFVDGAARRAGLFAQEQGRAGAMGTQKLQSDARSSPAEQDGMALSTR